MAMFTFWSASATGRIPSTRTCFDGPAVCSIRGDSISIVSIGIGSQGGEEFAKSDDTDSYCMRESNF